MIVQRVDSLPATGEQGIIYIIEPGSVSYTWSDFTGFLKYTDVFVSPTVPTDIQMRGIRYWLSTASDTTAGLWEHRGTNSAIPPTNLLDNYVRPLDPPYEYTYDLPTSAPSTSGTVVILLHSGSGDTYMTEAFMWHEPGFYIFEQRVPETIDYSKRFKDTVFRSTKVLTA